MVETALQIVRSDGKGTLLASKAAAAGALAAK
jgi:hypothetical protein